MTTILICPPPGPRHESDLMLRWCKKWATKHPHVFISSGDDVSIETIDLAVANIETTINAFDDEEELILFGHSRGGQDIGEFFRRQQKNRTVSERKKIRAVVTGNPENRVSQVPWLFWRGANARGLAPTGPWPFLDVTREKDAWGNWKLRYLLGLFTTHLNYYDVDLDNPKILDEYTEGLYRRIVVP